MFNLKRHKKIAMNGDVECCCYVKIEWNKTQIKRLLYTIVEKYAQPFWLFQIFYFILKVD